MEAERAISDSLSATEKASSSDSSSSKNLKRMTSTIAVDVIAETVLGESAFVKRLKPKHESKILQMVLSLDCKEVWTGCADGSLHVWGASSMERLKIYPAHTGRITSLVAGPNQVRSLFSKKVPAHRRCCGLDLELECDGWDCPGVE